MRLLVLISFFVFLNHKNGFCNPQNEVLIEVFYQNKKIDTSKPISFQNQKNYLNFNFGQSTTQRYFYKLEGIDTDSNLCQCNSVVYSNLYGGKYTFWVKDVENPHIYSKVDFTIQKNFWQEPWFILSLFMYLFVIIAVIVIGFLLFRFRQQTKLQRVRDNIASDLHDDVGATLSSISFFGEMMRSKILKNAPKEEVLPLLDKLISTSKETIETMRGVVWTINPNNDNAVDFFHKLQSFGKEMLSAKNIEYNIKIEGFENVKLPLDIQRNFFLFYKETINNIAKHSKATAVEASVKPLSKNSGIEFTISDNGVGFNPADIYEGHGLKSLRKRAEELEGELDMQSAEGNGTKISLSFILP